MLPSLGIGAARFAALYATDERPGPESTPRQISSAIVREAQRQALVALLEQGDRLLEVVLALARDPELVALDLGLDLEPGLPQGLGQRLGLVLGDPLEERARHPVVAAAGRPRLRRGQRLERDRPLHQLVLEHVEGGQRPLIGLGQDHHLLARPGERGTGVLEVEALRQFLSCLVDRVVDLLAVDLGDDVERGVGHGVPPSSDPGGTLADRGPQGGPATHGGWSWTILGSRSSPVTNGRKAWGSPGSSPVASRTSPTPGGSWPPPCCATPSSTRRPGCWSTRPSPTRCSTARPARPSALSRRPSP